MEKVKCPLCTWWHGRDQVAAGECPVRAAEEEEKAARVTSKKRRRKQW